MTKTQTRITEAINRVLDDSCNLFLSDIVDEESNVVGKFYISYSEDEHPYLITLSGNTLTVFDVTLIHTVVTFVKDVGFVAVYNYNNIPQSLLIVLYKHMEGIVNA